MVRHEKLALENTEDQLEEETGTKGQVRNLVLPILVLIIATVSMMIYTGAEALAADGKVFSVLGAFENTVVGTSLVVGGFCSIIISTLLIILDRQVSVPEYARSWIVGIKSMSGAIAILFFAWTINKIVGDMQTGKYLSSLVSGNIPMQFCLLYFFVLGSAMAFSTGTSWGTFGIMLPIAAAMAANAAPELLLPCLSAVMAGLYVAIIARQYRIQQFCLQRVRNVIILITLLLSFLMLPQLQQRLLLVTLWWVYLFRFSWFCSNGSFIDCHCICS